MKANHKKKAYVAPTFQVVEIEEELMQSLSAANEGADESEVYSRGNEVSSSFWESVNTGSSDEEE